ncbi:MAG: hypothetical protein JNK82_18995 [Myxococcaceae bacterium]|nr:hypothetical protein [Myxococcaceae bacterium]
MDQQLWAIGADARLGLLTTLGLERAERLTPDSSSTYLARHHGAAVALSSLGLWLSESNRAVRLDRRPHALMVGPGFEPPDLPRPGHFRRAAPGDAAPLVASALRWVACYEELVCSVCGPEHRAATLAQRRRPPYFEPATLPAIARELAAAFDPAVTPGLRRA